MAYIPLPAYRTGQGINLEPVNAALDSIMQQNNQNRQFGLQQRASDRADQQFAFEQGQAKQAADRQNVELFGKRATAIDQAFPVGDPRRAPVYQNLISTHQKMFPGQTLTEEELDPVTGPKLMAAQAGMYLDPRDSQAKDLALQETRAKINKLNDPIERQTREAQLGLIRAQTARANKGVDDPTNLRLRQLQAAGVDQNSPEGKAFLLTGQYNAKPVFSPAETAVDRNYAKSYEEDVAAGGLADMEKNISQLRGVRDMLTKKDGPNLTGPILGRVPDAIASITNPSAVNAREQVEEVVQRNLRVILGAQFTQNEGFALIKRAYNPALDEATNAKRLTRLVNTMDQALQAKKDAAGYYEQHGTLKGFKGKLNYTINDFDDAIEGGGSGGNIAQPKSPAERDALPSGTQYRAPDGSLRVKP